MNDLAIYGNTTGAAVPGLSKQSAGSRVTNFSDMLADARTDVGTKAEAPAPKNAAAEKFMKFQSMTIAEKIRASYLAAHKLTEEQLAALPPEERQKIEDAIKEEIRKAIMGGHDQQAVQPATTPDA
ncbi:MAG: hypothetical protein KGQ41_05310 [Alphaproteobacteria bacterium]|nr:hypothetical protein [Alphaproteobacteria bacterium]